MAPEATLFDNTPVDDTLLAHAERIDTMAHALIVEVGKFRERMLVAVQVVVASPAEKKPHEIKECLSWFDVQHQNRFAVPAKIDGGKDAAIMGRLIKTYGKDKVQSLTKEFFELDDEFVVRTGFTVGTFSMRVAGLISTAANPIRAAGVTPRTRDNGRNAIIGAGLIRQQAHAR